MVASKFDYGTCRLKDLQLQTETILNRVEVKGMTLHGEAFKPTKRFWTSLQMRFGFTPNIFRYFSHAEVFQRISEKSANDTLRFCVERNKKEKNLLAVTSPTTAVVQHDELKGMLKKYGAEEVAYANGILRSTHRLRHDVPVNIAGDEFRAKYVIDTPIDGFGRPAVYLAMLRLICANGAIAVTPVFRSELNCGKGTKGATFALERAVEGFNNEEGFSALQQRFESASKSWASVNECQKLYRVTTKVLLGGGLTHDDDEEAKKKASDTPVLSAFHAMTGDVGRIYGLTNVDALSIKRQRTLPVNCRVYDLLNFASELATHRANPTAARQLQSYIGDLVSGEYDLEGTADQYGDYRDFFIKHDETMATIHEMN